MILEKTKNKVPFIELEKGRLCFVKLTANKKGYKHLRFTDSTLTELSTSASSAKKKSKRKARTITIDERQNIVMDMGLIRGRTSSNPEGSGPPNGTIPLNTTKELRKMISKYVGEDGVFPYDKINLLKNKLIRDDLKKHPKPEVKEQEPEVKKTNTFSDSTSADKKRKKKKRVMKKKSRRKNKKKKRKKK